VFCIYALHKNERKMAPDTVFKLIKESSYSQAGLLMFANANAVKNE
jgi:hypothetical protein